MDESGLAPIGEILGELEGGRSLGPFGWHCGASVNVKLKKKEKVDGLFAHQL